MTDVSQDNVEDSPLPFHPLDPQIPPIDTFQLDDSQSLIQVCDVDHDTSTAIEDLEDNEQAPPYENFQADSPVLLDTLLPPDGSTLLAPETQRTTAENAPHMIQDIKWTVSYAY